MKIKYAACLVVSLASCVLITLLTDSWSLDGIRSLCSPHGCSSTKTIESALILKPKSQDKRLFIKDMAYYLLPPDGAQVYLAPSIAEKKRGVGTTSANAARVGSEMNTEESLESEAEIPISIAGDMFRQFHFIFLIRHPRSAIPSYYRASVPPLVEMTGWHDFSPSEAGYKELRVIFDYLRSGGQIGPAIAGRNGDLGPTVNGHGHSVEICMVDADDLLDKPAQVVEAVCRSVGLQFDPAMLSWGTKEEEERTREAFNEWLGWHEDALNSTGLKARSQVSFVLAFNHFTH